jgi:hypothetical protein
MDIVTFDYIAFDYFDPVSLDVSSDWRETTIRLRSEPHHTYISTRARSLSLSGKLVASVEKGDNGSEAWVTMSIKFLQSLNYPDYGTGDDYIKPPNGVRIYLAGITNEKEGYIKDLHITYDGILSKSGNPIIATASFSFVEVHDRPLSYLEVRGTNSLQPSETDWLNPVV